jgi:hypothetical protein
MFQVPRTKGDEMIQYVFAALSAAVMMVLISVTAPAPAQETAELEFPITTYGVRGVLQITDFNDPPAEPTQLLRRKRRQSPQPDEGPRTEEYEEDSAPKFEKAPDKETVEGETEDASFAEALPLIIQLITIFAGGSLGGAAGPGILALIMNLFGGSGEVKSRARAAVKKKVAKKVPRKR